MTKWTNAVVVGLHMADALSDGTIKQFPTKFA